MGKRIISLSNIEIETIARILGDAVTGSELTTMLNNLRIIDESGESTKWRRIYTIFNKRQMEDGNSHEFLQFIKQIVSPIRYVNSGSEVYQNLINEINKPLLLLGLEIQQDGIIYDVRAATTISEVERRTKTLRNELLKRGIHEDVLKCCKEEYLKENYFHAVLEASKSLSEKVREKTKLSEDGTKLFDLALSTKNPRLALNKLETSSECNQQNGLREMLNGVTHMIRNVTAHELKIKWVIEQKDAIDILTTISFLHKQLDECIVVPQFN